MIIADTGFFLALFNVNDNYHVRAIKTLNRLQELLIPSLKIQNSTKEEFWALEDVSFEIVRKPSWRITMKSTIVVEVTQEEDGGFIAEGLTENIFTQADTWAELKENVIEAVKGYYFDQPLVPNIKLHLVKDELLVVK